MTENQTPAEIAAETLAQCWYTERTSPNDAKRLEAYQMRRLLHEKYQRRGCDDAWVSVINASRSINLQKFPLDAAWLYGRRFGESLELDESQ